MSEDVEHECAYAAELDLFHEPPPGGWTVDDVPRLARTTERRFELLDGTVAVMPRQTGYHSRTRNNLWQAVERQLPQGLCAGSGMAVGITRKTALVPDLVVCRDAYGAHDWLIARADVRLVVEVLCDQSDERDRLTKHFRYAQAGIPYYWWIEPVADDAGRLRPEIHAHELDPAAGRYRLVGAPERDHLSVDLGFPVEIDVKGLYP